MMRAIAGACAALLLAGGEPARAGSPEARAAAATIANHEAAIAQLEKAVAAERAAIDEHLEEMADLRPTWVFGAPEHPIVARFREIYDDADSDEGRRRALDAYDRAHGEWELQMWGDDASFGQGSRRQDWERWHPVLEEGDERVAGIRASLDRIADLRAAIDGLQKTIDTLRAGAAPRTGTPAPARDAAHAQRVVPRMPASPQPGPRRPSPGRY